MVAHLVEAARLVSDPLVIGVMLASAIYGLFVGSIPGLTTATGAVPGDAFRRNIPARRIALDHKFADNIMGLYLVEPPFQKRRLQFRGMDRSSEKIHGQGFRRQSVERGGSRICGHQPRPRAPICRREPMAARSACGSKGNRVHQ